VRDVKRNALQNFAIVETQVDIAERDQRFARDSLYFPLRRFARQRAQRVRNISRGAERRDVARHASDYRWKPADSSAEFRAISRAERK
jgi:hypothetical protein